TALAPSENRLDLLHGVLGAHLREHAEELALLVDDERGADDAHVLLAVERLLTPRVPRLRDRVVLVSEEREAERVLVVELQLLRRRVGTDADDRNTEPLQRRVRVAQLARLRRATGRVGLRVEVHDQLLTLEVSELHLLPVLVDQREVRSLVTDRERHG